MIVGVALLVHATTPPAARDSEASGENASPVADAAAPFERTEERAPCAHATPIRQPMFGDLHVHSSFSFDSYTSGQREDPWAAYGFGRGESIILPNADGDLVVEAKLRRPLDFVSVTDHAEFFGDIRVCTGDPWTLGYWTPLCLLTRTSYFYPSLFAAGEWAELIMQDRPDKERPLACALTDCPARSSEVWAEIQRATEEHYDRSSDCEYTTFVGYEYTDTPGGYNMHRNVVFRNDRVTEDAIDSFDMGARNFPGLWKRLRAECTERGDGCDVITIPHNPNLAGGLMFRDPETPEEARDRLAFEPVVELIQHKASSECRYDRLEGRGLETNDEQCTFEQNLTDNLASLAILFGELQSDQGAPVALDDFSPRNLVRNVLKDGLALGADGGVNPFQMGFIGSTDTHSAAPGATEEDNYPGHLGKRDAGYRNVQDHYQDNPGGLAVVWAEENSRDAIFAGLERRETYATSGTRPTLRFFAGADLSEDLCARVDAIETAYASGVPMGGELEAEAGAPRFFVSAMQDAGSPGHPGTALQRLQIVKGWVDAGGITHEQVFDVAGGPNDATVDTDTCAPIGEGHASLCSVWTDPGFDPTVDAFYYVRLLENPSCRWSTLQCMDVGVNPFADDCEAQASAADERFHAQGAMGNVWGNCCLSADDQPFLSPTIQERAWSSPVWIHRVKTEIASTGRP